MSGANRLTAEVFDTEFDDGTEVQEVCILLDGEVIATMEGNSTADVALANWLCTADPAKAPK